MSVNRQGLSRTIPAEVRREVRARCGFGCAICGATITEYEHFLPDFRDAEVHDPSRIVLLCPSHHAEVTKGVIPKEDIVGASQNPAAKAAGFSSRSLPWFKENLTFKVGGVVTRGTPIPFCIRGEMPLQFGEPEEGSEVILITARIRGPDGGEILHVHANEWRVANHTADFEWVGNRYRFRSSDGEIILQIRFEPPDLLVIEKMLAMVGGAKLEANEEFLEIDGMRMPMLHADNCGMGLMIG